MNVYLFGAPALLGGAATKIRHLLYLLKDDFSITVVFKHRGWLKDAHTTQWLKRIGVSYAVWKDMPNSLAGIALVICEPACFVDGSVTEMKRRGLKVVFSNEMMFPFEGEAEAVKQGLVDKVLFVSDFQAAAFAELYREVPSCVTGNYIAPEEFGFKQRRNVVFSIGRLSRADPDKYPDDFPVFYEELGISEIRFRVMGWDEKVAKKFRWHTFDERWQLLRPLKESAAQFLYSLDLFVYPIGHRVLESWGRASVEAMLTGCIPIVPAGHRFHNFLVSGETGYICEGFDNFREAVIELYDNYDKRTTMARACSEHASTCLCNKRKHLEVWTEALTR